MASNEKLHETFNLDPEGYDDESEDEVEGSLQFPYEDIPTELSLDDITYMAVHSYREQLKDINEMPVKHRQRALEVAHNYLSLAKDSIYRREDLELKATKKNGTKSINTEEDDESSGKKIDREEAYKRLNNESS